MEIPKWLDDPALPRPCPCGRPPDDDVVMVELEDGIMWLHEGCLRRAMGPEWEE